MSAPMCPRCKGHGVIDTSPPGVENTAPWLQTDTDCPDCDGTGLLSRPAPPEVVALGEAVDRLTEAIKDAARRDLATVARAAQRLRERLTR